MGIGHICGDNAASYFLIEIAIRPLDPHWPGCCSRHNKSATNQSIDVDFEPAFQTSSLTWSRHHAFPSYWPPYRCDLICPDLPKVL
jgi:hypothetical protein